MTFVCAPLSIVVWVSLVEFILALLTHRGERFGPPAGLLGLAHHDALHVPHHGVVLGGLLGGLRLEVVVVLVGLLHGPKLAKLEHASCAI